MFAAASATSAVQFQFRGGGRPLSTTIPRKKHNHSLVSSRLKLPDSLPCILRYPDELYSMVRLKLALTVSEKQIPAEPPHWRFCYSTLYKMDGSHLIIQQIDEDVRDAFCIYALVLRALDTIEDDSTIATEVKVPILQTFHRRIRDGNFHFSNGAKYYKALMENFHHVTTAFLELDCRFQEVIEDITMKMGAGMAKFICKEINTIDDYDEYCHYPVGLCMIGASKMYSVSRGKSLASEDLSNAMGLFFQKVDTIKDYPDDINMMPNPRMLWPRQIWGKYVDKLEDLKNEDNSAKALLCLNEMVTNALTHVEDSLKYLSTLPDPAIFRGIAIFKVIEFGTLALCYNNIEVFRSGVGLRPGLAAKIFYNTSSMSDVYEAVHDFSFILESKISDNNPNDKVTRSLIDTIKKCCRSSLTSNQRKSYII
ncbi:squalene synthase 8-like isoform X2 [Andrographis paniculata]|uniref:squalene synthase 8-like isoform X2 n=1 Tax=Andrographis paniculata TaxID=175694 RepID=UPI0021E80D7E|nr:squalene synthase 8-like isoform X2 [Andrographis paniculata]